MQFHFKRFLLIGVLINFFATTAHSEDLANGKAKFESLCMTCHGAGGAGDGPVAAALPPEQKPANLTGTARKFAVDKAKFTELLQKGGAAVGLNPLMPPQASLTAKDIDDLYAFTESLKKK